MDQVEKKQRMTEEQLCYLPPTLEDGILKSAIMVSDGIIVGEQLNSPVTPIEQPPHSEEVPADTDHAEVPVAVTPVM